MKLKLSKALSSFLFAACAIPSVAEAAPVLQFEVAQITSSKLDVNVRLDNVTDLYAYQMGFVFDPLTLGYRGAMAGSFLGSGGPTYYEPATVDSALGRLSYSFESLLGAVDGVSGSGVLQTLSFDRLSLGAISLEFIDVIDLDSSLNNIDLSIQKSGFSVPEPSDLSLVSVALLAWILTRRRRVRPQCSCELG